jgi:hypothetical protein
VLLGRGEGIDSREKMQVEVGERLEREYMRWAKGIWGQNREGEGVGQTVKPVVGGGSRAVG